MHIIRSIKKAVCIVACVSLAAGCKAYKADLQEARSQAHRSRQYYESAARRYEELIKKGGPRDELYFELGKLHYENGDFERAIQAFRDSRDNRALKLLAIAYYKNGRFADAFEVFERSAPGDEEWFYYRGLTCERLNLFDQALAAYAAIRGGPFFPMAQARIATIEKNAGQLWRVEEVSPALARIIASAPSQERYPQAGALILSCQEQIEVTPQNTQVSTLHYAVKILNERGKEDFSESHIEYDSTYEKVELEYARTIRPDGTIVEVGSRHIRDVSKYLNFPLYSNARVYIISFPEVSEGAVIEYKLKIYRSTLINEKDFILSYPLQADEPIIAATFSLRLPAGREVRFKRLNEDYNTFGAEMRPRVSQEAGYSVYLWEFKEIPQIVPESDMPPEVEVNPTVAISTFKEWQEVYRWWWALSRDKMEADAAIKEKVAELTAGSNSDEEKAKAIYGFCAQKIRYVAVEYGQAGYEPHKAQDIFRNKYGDCKDQAVLLVTMLKEAGLEAWPVLISTKSYYNAPEDFPSALFNHCIACVDIAGELVFLDPTAETCSFGDLPVDDQARRALVCKEEGFLIRETPFYPASHNLIQQGLKLTLNSDESVTGEKTTVTRGMYDQTQRYWLLYTPPELIESALREKIQDVSIGATLVDYDIENRANPDKPLVLRYSFKGPEYATAAGRLRILPQLVYLDTSLVAKESRQYPIDFAVLDTKEISYEIEIPPDFSVRYIPEDVKAESPWLKVAVAYSRKGRAIRLTQKMELKRQYVTREEYPAFKEFFEGLAKKIKQRIVLERKE